MADTLPFYLRPSVFRRGREQHKYRRDCNCVNAKTRASAASRWVVGVKWPWRKSCEAEAAAKTVPVGNRSSLHSDLAQQPRFSLKTPCNIRSVWAILALAGPPDSPWPGFGRLLATREAELAWALLWIFASCSDCPARFEHPPSENLLCSFPCSRGTRHVTCHSNTLR